jgi:hypothetical protein
MGNNIKEVATAEIAAIKKKQYPYYQSTSMCRNAGKIIGSF